PIIKTALEEAVSKANDFLVYAVKGNGADRYPDTEYDALTAAKAAAQAVIDNTAATQAEVSAATTALNDALAACIAAVKPFNPDVAKTYNIIHYGSLYLNAIEYEEGSKTNALNLAAASQADNQLVQFIAVPNVADVYNITIASVPSKYLTRCTDPHATEEGKYDDYKLIWADDASSPYAQFEMKRAGVQNYYTIKCITAGPQRTLSYMGTDAVAAESGIAIDKNGTSTNHYWRIVEPGQENSIQSISKNNVFVHSNKGNLTVANLEGANKVAIYSITGQLISVETGVYSQYTKSLSQGMYIVVIEGATPYRGKAVVR
ncbi:MAG: T9SS type A sorting domain-containing protein, partial [Bacteroidales bacterium]|nr:T9SS type A sorting domain-containing protein [Bacteroidales bacterium]